MSESESDALPLGYGAINYIFIIIQKRKDEKKKIHFFGFLAQVILIKVGFFTFKSLIPVTFLFPFSSVT